VLPKDCFYIERKHFDEWAAWIRTEQYEHLGLPANTWLARLILYGERMGLVNYAATPDDADELFQRISSLMESWVTSDPQLYRALVARHCDRMTDKQGAKVVYGDNLESFRKAFQRLCLQGYEMLRNYGVDKCVSI
jgi:hypothetical protein